MLKLVSWIRKILIQQFNKYLNNKFGQQSLDHHQHCVGFLGNDLSNRIMQKYWIEVPYLNYFLLGCSLDLGWGIALLQHLQVYNITACSCPSWILDRLIDR